MRIGSSRTPATTASALNARAGAPTTRRSRLELRAVTEVEPTIHNQATAIGTRNSLSDNGPEPYLPHFCFSLSESFSASCALMRKNVGMKSL